MSKISMLVFNNAGHYITSKFGYRKSFNVNGQMTNSFHSGTDYGTSGQKLPQYAIEDGEVLSCGTDKSGGKYAWIKYPRLNVKMLHYHLDKVSCKKGQKVSRGTLIGYTGMTGKATGIHLHFSIVDLTTGAYLDPEAFTYTEPEEKKPEVVAKDGFLPKKGYFGYKDTHPNIAKVAKFMRATFPAYTPIRALGPVLGPNLFNAVKEFQKRAKEAKKYNDAIDGNIGPKTLAALRSYGFKY